MARPRLLSVATLTALVVLLVVGAVVGWHSLTAPVDPEDPEPTPSASGCVREFAKGDRVAASRVRVSVYNAGNRTGLAATVRNRLEARGFLPGEARNAPARYRDVRVVRVLAPSVRDPAARLVALQFGQKTFVQRTGVELGPGVEVVVGNNFVGLVDAPRELTATRPGSGC
jgi:hypothetical protein